MPNAATIRVKGLAELDAAFRIAGSTLQKTYRADLRKIGEPIRADAERLARSNISRIGSAWSEMRVGVTSRLVYVAPKRRGRNPRLKRPNLAGLLMGRAMEPALEQNVTGVETEIGHLLDIMGRTWERV